jgi:hypothetical protein
MAPFRFRTTLARSNSLPDAKKQPQPKEEHDSPTGIGRPAYIIG